MGYTFRDVGGYSIRDPTGFSTDSGKNQFADTVSAAPVDFDANQVRLPAQPVHTANTAFPTSHDLTTLLVRARNLPLGLASVTQRLPLFGRDPSEEGGVDGVQDVQVGDDGTSEGRARVGALDLLVRRGRRAGFDDDRPWELVRSENELIGGGGRWICGRLGKGVRRDRRVGGTIQNGPS